MGKCLANGLCSCNDANADSLTGCKYCKSGYLKDSKGVCVFSDCTSGPMKVPGCARCALPGPYFCVECEGGALPVGMNDCGTAGSSGGLSNGAIAGVVVGVVVVVAVVAFCVYWFVFRKRGTGTKRNQQTPGYVATSL